MSKAYGCDGTPSIVLPRGAPTRLADDILNACLVHPAQSAGKAELLPSTLFSAVQANINPTNLSRQFHRRNRGLCMTVLLLIAGRPLYFALQQSIYFVHGAKDAAMAIVSPVSAVLMWRMLLAIMSKISFDVMSPLRRPELSWPKLNWPKMNWHSANLPVVLLKAVSAGAPFLFFVGKAGSLSL